MKPIITDDVELELEESSLKKTTLQEQGPKLPIGIYLGGKLHKGFSPKEKFDGRDEKKIQKWRRRHPNVSVGQLISHILASRLETFGPHMDFAKKDYEERRVVLSQSHMADVLYSYFYLRFSVLGKKLSVRNTCPFCKKRNKVALDLGTLETTVVETWEECLVPVDLPDGVSLDTGESEGEGRKLFSRMVLSPPKWYPIENLGEEEDGELESATLPSCVHEIPGTTLDILAGQEWVDRLTKLDLETLNGVQNNDFAQPELVLELSCRFCSGSWDFPLNWSYDHFFGSSSLK